MNLPSDLQRLLPYVVVAVLAVAGLLLVLRGVGGGDGGGPEPRPIDRGGEVRNGGGSDARSGRDGSQPDGGTGGTGAQERSKPSAKAYVSCVEQASNSAALEQCQALLPR
jgi:hypothetical protein